MKYFESEEAVECSDVFENLVRSVHPVKPIIGGAVSRPANWHINKMVKLNGTTGDSVCGKFNSPKT